LNALEIKGLNLITPNRKEAFLLSRQLPPHDNQSVSPDELKQLASYLHQRWAPQYVLITLGAQGMVLFDKLLNASHLPTTEREVFDVSGAGDTVAAVCASVMAAGHAVLDGAKLANIAAGTVIKHLGTVPVNVRELKDAVVSIS
jgi:D-beta-D-heptose 7-phosphate kinase/D-beta-D-heptose 1-phosphate adenosyltransferase